MNGKLRVAAIGLALSVAAVLLLLVVRSSLDPARLRPLPLIAGAWLAFLVAAWLLRKVPRRTAVVLILLGGIGLQTVAVSVPRAFSTDLYRYMWDGRVQAAGIDPYQYRSEEHTSELQSRLHLVCRLLLEKKTLNARYRRAVKAQVHFP